MAQDVALVDYDTAKSAALIMRAKEANDTLVHEVQRAQAKALAISARAEVWLA